MKYIQHTLFDMDLEDYHLVNSCIYHLNYIRDDFDKLKKKHPRYFGFPTDDIFEYLEENLISILSKSKK